MKNLNPIIDPEFSGRVDLTNGYVAIRTWGLGDEAGQSEEELAHYICAVLKDDFAERLADILDPHGYRGHGQGITGKEVQAAIDTIVKGGPK